MSRQRGCSRPRRARPLATSSTSRALLDSGTVTRSGDPWKPAVPGNEYFVLRHGESEANRAGIVVSAPDNAARAYGLTDRGRAQVAEGIERSRDMLAEVDTIITSPFLRTLESAAVAAEILGAAVTRDPRLAERGFGALELTPATGYHDVWARDRLDATHADNDVESVDSVFHRVTRLIDELDASLPHRRLLLCTHGDVASVLICAFAGEDPRRHREIGALANGEVRRLTRGRKAGG